MQTMSSRGADLLRCPTPSSLESALAAYNIRTVAGSVKTANGVLVTVDTIGPLATRLRELIFHDYFAVSSQKALAQAAGQLFESLLRLSLIENRSPSLSFSEAKEKAIRLTEAFLQRLPQLCQQCEQDAQAIYKKDVACESVLSAVIAYPGVYALNLYRLAHVLYKLGARLLARIISEYAHRQTAIDIHPAAVIGEACVIDHGHGTVIGETAIVGDRVFFYHNVTLGARGSVHAHATKNTLRHPIIEDDVILFANATILGRITIGAQSVIGASALIRQDVPARTVVKSSTVSEHRKQFSEQFVSDGLGI